MFNFFQVLMKLDNRETGDLHQFPGLMGEDVLKNEHHNKVPVVSSLSESFFMVKGAALFLQQGSSTQEPKTPTHHKHAGEHTPAGTQACIRIDEFCSQGCLQVYMETATTSLPLPLLPLFVITHLPPRLFDAPTVSRRVSGDLPQHLQIMFKVLRSEDRIKLVSVALRHHQILFFSLLMARVAGVTFTGSHRPCAWKVAGPNGFATWWSSTPMAIKTRRRTLSWGWTLLTKTGRLICSSLSFDTFVSSSVFLNVLCVLGSKVCSIGMVLPLWSDTNIHLDGDGQV